MRTIPLFFAVDDRYAPYFFVAATSIIENASKDYNYEIVVLYQVLSEENKKAMKALETENFRIRLESMEEKLTGVTDKITNKLNGGYFTMTIYFRLFIPSMFPEYDKGIYLDSDIVVPGDISKLYEEDLKGNLIGACRDLSIQDAPPLLQYIESVVGVDSSTYVNSGILLLDMKGLREAKFEEQFVRILTTYKLDTIAPDQDYINAMCENVIHHLPDTYDVMPGSDPKVYIEEPVIIHYNLFEKPWKYEGVQYEDYFWDYAKKTDYFESLLEARANYTEEQKVEDGLKARAMAERGMEIMEKPVTFKTVFEKEEKKLKRA